MSQILITEKQLEMLSHTILVEQEETVDEKQILDNLQNELNRLLSEEQNDVLSNIKLKVSGTGLEDMKVNIAGVTIPLKWNPQRRRGSFSTSKPIGFGNVGTAQFIPQLESNPQYKQLLDKYPTVREQIEEGEVNLIIRPQTPGKQAFIEIAPTSMSRKERRKIKLNLADTFNLKDLLTNNLVNMKFDKKTKGQLFTDNMSWKLSRLGLNLPTEGGEVPETVTPQIFNFNTTDNYLLNSANLTPAAIQQIQDNILTPIRLLGPNLPAYIQQLNDMTELVITAFASRDDDPTATDYNSDPNTRRRLYRPCVNETTRGAYNQCLSAARAQAVVTHLQTTAPQIFGGVNFSAVGGGENITSGNQWVEGKTDHDSDTTIGDRNFTINLPQFTTLTPTPRN